MFNQILRGLREKRGLSQKNIAEFLNISRQAYNHYESGKRQPSYEILKLLADFFDVSTDYLLGRDEIETIAAHHDGDEYTEEELRSIEEFKEFVRRRKMEKEGK